MTSRPQIIITLSLLALLAVALPASAAEPTVRELTTDYASKGTEVRVGDQFILGLRPNLFSAPANVTITPDAPLPIPLPARYLAAGTVFRLQIDTVASETQASNTLWLKVKATPVPSTATVLLGYDPVANMWNIVGTKLDAANMMIGTTRWLHTTLVPVTDTATAPSALGPDVAVTPQTQILPVPVGSLAMSTATATATYTLRAQALVEPAAFILTPDLALPAPLPIRYSQRSPAAFLAFRTDAGVLMRMAKGAVIQPKVSQKGFLRQRVLFYNPAKKVWELTQGNTVYVAGYVVVVDDLGEEIGIASWYASRKYPDGVAHNRYPMGTKLKVTNLENNKSTVVKVVSRGPYVRGRVIDLVSTAFKKIKGKNGGLAQVKVAVVDPKVLGESIDASQPTLPPTDPGSTALVALPVSSTAAIAYDVDKGMVVAGKNIDERHPVASLTKLMTALVYLDRNPSFKNIVTYQKTDGAICSCLYVSVGETMTTNDLWHAMLIGSANNATRALARSTKLTEAQFVKLMNDKAKALGLDSLTFADPTGLDPANQGSAADMAKLAAIALSKPQIAKVAVKTSYSFSTLNTKKAHTIKNRNKMLETDWQVTGIKTGYIEESGNCLITQVKGKTTGRTIVTVVLGAASAAKQYADTEKALSIGFANLK
ncbi:MAG: RlpA-like double-psi beta-barrel domain-containing protein [Patescibacteria group bacterium]